QVGTRDSRIPRVGADLMPRDVRDCVPDFVVVVDSVQRLVLYPGPAPRGDPDLEQHGIEDRLLRGGMRLEKRREPRPHGGQRFGIRPVDLLKDREQAPLLVVIVEYQLGDIHSSPISDGHLPRTGAAPAAPGSTLARSGAREASGTEPVRTREADGCGFHTAEGCR